MNNYIKKFPSLECIFLLPLLAASTDGLEAQHCRVLPHSALLCSEKPPCETADEKTMLAVVTSALSKTVVAGESCCFYVAMSTQKRDNSASSRHFGDLQTGLGGSNLGWAVADDVYLLFGRVLVRLSPCLGDCLLELGCQAATIVSSVDANRIPPVNSSLVALDANDFCSCCGHLAVGQGQYR